MSDPTFDPGEGWQVADQLRARLVELDEFGHFHRGWVKLDYTPTERHIIDELTRYFQTTFVIDHGDDLPLQIARDVLAVLQDRCGI